MLSFYTRVRYREEWSSNTNYESTYRGDVKLTTLAYRQYVSKTNFENN